MQVRGPGLASSKMDSEHILDETTHALLERKREKSPPRSSFALAANAGFQESGVGLVSYQQRDARRI